jgi:16S rRNA (cytidine1402-2'-O)-methyltransferase
MSKLYLVPTPIGNLEDITLRALRILKEEVDLILAEDTRKTGILLKHYGISKPMMAFHQHNEHHQVTRIVERLKSGERMALVTDAGSPGISDPGFLLTRACVQEDVVLESLPGPTAFVPALLNSGLPCDRFLFEGFLPLKKGRSTRISEIVQLPLTVVLYESPHRLVKTLQQIAECSGNERYVSVSRELTKLYEENIRGPISDVIRHFSATEVKGELVIVLSGAPKKERQDH